MFLTMNPQQIQDKLLFFLFFFFLVLDNIDREKENRKAWHELLKNHVFLAMITWKDRKLMKIEAEIECVVIFQRERETMCRYFAWKLTEKSMW